MWSWSNAAWKIGSFIWPSNCGKPEVILKSFWRVGWGFFFYFQGEDFYLNLFAVLTAFSSVIVQCQEHVLPYNSPASVTGITDDAPLWHNGSYEQLKDNFYFPHRQSKEIKGSQKVIKWSPPLWHDSEESWEKGRCCSVANREKKPPSAEVRNGDEPNKVSCV